MPGSARPGSSQFSPLRILVAAQFVVACVGTSSARPSTTTPSLASAELSRAPVSTPTATLTTAVVPDITTIALPDLGGGVVVAGDSLWDATDSGAVLVDTDAGTVSDVIPGVTNLAFDGERLWAGGEELLLELDPRTGKELQRFAIDFNAFYLAATPDAIWVTDPFRSQVRRIDPADGRVVATIAVPPTPKGTRLAEGALWIACDGNATVVRINTQTNQIEAEIRVGFGPHTIAGGGGWVWVTNRHSSSLSKIDPATNAVVATVEDVATNPAVGVDVGPDAVYVAVGGGLARVDPDLAQITRRFEIDGASFYDLRVMGDVLWASNGSSPELMGFDLQALSD
jgi:virginiamycin B lyase